VGVRSGSAVGPLSVVVESQARAGTRKYRFKLEDLQNCCPWYDQAVAYYTNKLGSGVSAQYTIACKLHNIDLSTMKNYGPKWLQFVAFCRDHGRVSLPADVDTVVLYVGWMAERGTVRGTSMGQYLSCISKAHEHLDLSSPVQRGGKEIADTVDGMVRLQVATGQEDEVLYLPAPYVETVLLWSLSVLAEVRRLNYSALSAADMVLLGRVRDATAVVFNFCNFGRADSLQSMRQQDVSISPLRVTIFRLRKVKRRSGKFSRLVFQWPPSAQPGVTDMLECYLWVRSQLKCTVNSRMWVLPFDAARVAPVSTAKFDALVQRVLLQHGITTPAPEDGSVFVYSTRSLRAGAASAAAVLNVPMPKIRRLGGWSPDSATPERSYIDPTCPPTPAGRRFFAWLMA
jgi:hypothetical protein